MVTLYGFLLKVVNKFGTFEIYVYLCNIKQQMYNNLKTLRTMLKVFNFIGSIALAVYTVVYYTYAWTVKFPYYLGKVVVTGSC